MTQGDPEDVVQAAEAYFKKFEIKALLTQILVKLGEERPEDPAKAIRSHLESELRPEKEGSPNHAQLSKDDVPDEEHDADTSLFQAACSCHGRVTGYQTVSKSLAANSRQVDLMRVLVNEKLPGEDESGEDLSTRHWLQPHFSFFCPLSL
eukprot:Skav231060  [mRNA]  locus=scaffold768:50705:51154:+ [translate_table: standard]